MPLVNTTEMFKKAYEGGYAVGAFNVNNMEIIQGITQAASKLRAPLILQVSSGARWRKPDFPSLCIWIMAIPLNCANPVLTVVLPLS